MPLTPQKLIEAKREILQILWRREPSFATAAEKIIDLIGEAEELSTVAGAYEIKMDKPGDVVGGGTTQSVGFQVIDAGGADVAVQALVQFAAFDDAFFAIPARTALLDTASAGTIIGGGASAAIVARSDATGKFTCTLADATDEKVYLATCAAFGSGAMNCLDTDVVEFKP